MKKFCYINGKIIEEHKACINPFDLGVLRGYGIFDVMCTANGKPFHITDHWHGLVKSAHALRLAIPVTQKEYKKIINDLLKKSPYEHTSVRTVLTGGVSSNGITLPEHPTFFILLHDMDQFKPSAHLYAKGGKLITDDFLRSHHASKTTSYIEAIRNQKQKTSAKAVEILFVHDGIALECATSNIFIVLDGVLTTPHSDIFQGVTRKVVLKLARKNGIPVSEREISLQELFSAHEIFITGSAKHILPVTKIDAHTINDGKPGSVTQKLMHIYKEYRDNY